MSDRSHVTAGLIGAVLAALCCGAPLLIAALGSISVSTWLAHANYVLVPAVLILVAAVALLLYRRWTLAQDYRPPHTNKRGTKL
jgi:mercuric ion transport protein